MKSNTEKNKLLKIKPQQCWLKLNYLHGRSEWDNERDFLLPVTVKNIAYYDDTTILYDYEIMEGVAQPPLPWLAFSRHPKNHRKFAWNLLWMALKHGVNEQRGN